MVPGQESALGQENPGRPIRTDLPARRPSNASVTPPFTPTTSPSGGTRRDAGAVGRRLQLAGLFAAHAGCSVSMVLLNKTIAQGFDFPWTVVFIQNVGTVLIGYLHPLLCGSRGSRNKVDSKEDDLPLALREERGRRRLFGMKVPLKAKNKLWVLLQVTFFMGTLFTSLKALRFVSVPLYVVARNTVPAQTALLEWLFTSTRIRLSAAMGLVSTILGAVLYTYGDLHAGLAVGGLAYAVVQTLIVSACSIIDNTSVRILGREEDMTPVEVNQLRVAVALPVNLLFVAAFESGFRLTGESPAGFPFDEKPKLYASLANMPFPVLASLLLSTLFGFGMGTFNFYLQQFVSAATVQVANILYKLSTTLISLVTHPTPVSGVSWLGYAISLQGIALYTFAPTMGILRCPFHSVHGEGDEK